MPLTFASFRERHADDGKKSAKSDEPLLRLALFFQRQMRMVSSAAGWMHEQDNTKIRVGADGAVVAVAREVGVNSHMHTAGYDFTAGREAIL